MKTTTYMITREQALDQRKWYLIDANDKVLGRLATQVADLLRGKGNPKFTPHVDAGDFVVIVNAEGIRLSGNKLETKIYRRHSGYPGGLRTWSAGREIKENPERMLRAAVRGMLPKNRLGRQLATKLKVYAGAEHPHVAQTPIVLS